MFYSNLRKKGTGRDMDDFKSILSITELKDYGKKIGGRTLSQIKSEVTTPQHTRTGDSERSKPQEKTEKQAKLQRFNPATSENLATTRHAESFNPEQKLTLTENEQNLERKYGDHKLKKILDSATLDELRTLNGIFEKLKSWEINKKKKECTEELEQKYGIHIGHITQAIKQREVQITHLTE